MFHIFKNGIFTERVTGSTPFHPLVSYLDRRHFRRDNRPLHPFSSSGFISSKRAFSLRELPAPPLFILLFYIFKKGVFTERVTVSTPFHPLVSYLQKRHFHPEGYRLHLFSSSCFIASKTAFSPRGLPAPPRFIVLLHIFKSGVFSERDTGSTSFHPLVSFLQRRHFHREGDRPPLFILLFHIFKKRLFFSERVTGSTPFHPLVSYLQKRRFHREGYRLHPFSSSCFISSKTTFSPEGLPAPPLFILLFHIFKNGIFTETVTGSTPFLPYLHIFNCHREGCRLHPFSSSCFISSKTAFSVRGLPAPPLFILLFHIFKNRIFTERVTGSTPFLPLVSYLQRRHFHRAGYRLHPFSSSCFITSKMTFSPRGLPAPPLFMPLVSYLQRRHVHREGYRLHPFSSSCFISSNRHFHREGYRLHPFSSSCFISSITTFSRRGLPAPPLSSSCFISSKTVLSPRGLPAPPLFILLFHIFKNGIFTEKVTGFTPFHPLVSYLQKRNFHISAPTGLLAPPLFNLFFHISRNGIFTHKVTGSTPFHLLVPYLQKRHFHREGYQPHPFHPLVSYLQKRHFHRKDCRLCPFSSSCFISSKTAFSPRGLPAPTLFILMFHFFKNDAFTERITGSAPFHPLVSYLEKRRFYREGYRLHPFSSSCFKSRKTTFSPRGLPAPPLFSLLFHIFQDGVFTERVTGSTPFPPLVSYLHKRFFYREGYRFHPFSSSCFIPSKTAFSPRGLPAPPLFILLFHFF